VIQRFIKHTLLGPMNSLSSLISLRSCSSSADITIGYMMTIAINADGQLMKDQDSGLVWKENRAGTLR
jgi:hypothetical protein